MTDIEQIMAEAINALRLNPYMTAWDKYLLCDQLADMATKAAFEFSDQDARETEERDAA